MPLIHYNIPAYNQLVLLVVREAARRGNDPQEVLPGAHWLIAWGYLSEAELVQIPPGDRATGSSQVREVNHFFTNDNDLMRFGDRTYALSSVWGRDDADGVVRRIINDNDFGLDNITYEP